MFEQEKLKNIATEFCNNWILPQDRFNALKDFIESVNAISQPLEAEVSKLLLSELRKHYLVEIDFDTGEPKADMKTLMELWDKVNNYLEIKAVGKS